MRADFWELVSAANRAGASGNIAEYGSVSLPMVGSHLAAVMSWFLQRFNLPLRKGQMEEAASELVWVRGQCPPRRMGNSLEVGIKAREAAGLPGRLCKRRSLCQV
jgi:hypothetical protein